VTLVALATGVTVHALVSDATEARDRFGELVGVVVVQRAIDPGDVLDAGDLAVERWPSALVPEGALRQVPRGRAARVALVPGEVLVGERIAPDGLSGVAAAVPDGWRALTVPVDPSAAPPVASGDRVDVLVTIVGAGGGGGLEVPTVVAAPRALVVDVTETAVTVAVPAERASRVAFGIAAGHVVLAVAGA
jgi:pilus assembly protein CpaB